MKCQITRFVCVIQTLLERELDLVEFLAESNSVLLQSDHWRQSGVLAAR